MADRETIAIDVRDAVKRYGDFTALQKISLSIFDNEFFTLLGPSGCGKTTLLRMIAGFEDVTEGAIYLFGDEIEDLPPNKRPVNTVFQNYALFPHMTITENVGFGLEMRGSSKSEARRRARAKCWNSCSCRNLPPESHPSSRAASNSAWRWHGPLPLSQRCCCWTSRCRRLT